MWRVPILSKVWARIQYYKHLSHLVYHFDCDCEIRS